MSSLMSTVEQPGESDLYFLYFRNIDDTQGRGGGCNMVENGKAG